MLEYNVVGLMSGTSLDGLDIALCNFKFINDKWGFKVFKAETFEYDKSWKNKLTSASEISGFELIKLHKEYGNFIGEKAKEFLKRTDQKVDLISSHGHTVFHIPKEKINFQIGAGEMIASVCEITTVSDFRSLDIALNGQGAPLVPIGDNALFGNYNCCVNLGGFANISFNDIKNNRIAYDICPVNMVLNELAKIKGLDYDKDGFLGEKGNISHDLLTDLNNLDFYNQKAPKSLSREWYISNFKVIIDKYKIDFYDKIRTVYEHISLQLAKSFKMTTNVVDENETVLITGGGALNKFLVNILKTKTKAEIIIPNKEIVEYKEAIIFAFLGLLRYKNEVNCLSSVTGSKFDNCGGVIHEIAK